MAAHVFVASGEACPICEALAGSIVPPGFQPHDNCNCDTVKSEGDCEFEYEEGDVFRSGSRYRVTLMVTVTCPDGRSVQTPGITVDQEAMRNGDNDDLLEDVAEQACDELCGDDEAEDWLCC